MSVERHEDEPNIAGNTVSRTKGRLVPTGDAGVIVITRRSVWQARTQASILLTAHTEPLAMRTRAGDRTASTRHYGGQRSAVTIR